MQTVTEKFEFTTEVNRSKFITYLLPMSAFKDLYEELKRSHPKANHVVYAYRDINEFNQVVENYTDDGEPKGCAGVPTINVLRGEELVNCAILTVRYFGGIKLGTGGMARAYALAVKNVLEVSTLHEYIKEYSYSFETTYSNVEKTMYRLKQLGIENIKRDFVTQGVEWEILASKDKLARFKEF